MGFFDRFGSKKKAAEEKAEEEARKQEQDLHDSRVQAQKDAHAGMPWPGVMRMNLLKTNTQNQEETKIEDPITPERKDEIGNLIYEPRITPDDVTGLNLQELIFLLDTHEIFNRKAALENYETNHRVIYNDLLRRIHEADRFYILYDRMTGYPLIDSSFALVYLDKDHAEKAAQIYGTQFRKAAVLERPGEGAPEPEDGSRPVLLFDYLYYLGMENIIIDNGWYKAAIKRGEISAPPTSWTSENQSTPPAEPKLSFAMIDFIGEVKWPVRYEKREERLRKKMDRINALIPNAKFVVPVVVMDRQSEEGAAPEKQVKFPLIKLKARTKDSEIEQNFIPLFTDLFEYAKNFAKTEFKPVTFEYKNIVRFLRNADGFVINPRGESIVIPKKQAVQLAVPVKLVKDGKPTPQAPGEEAPGKAPDIHDFREVKEDSRAEEAPDTSDTTDNPTA